MTTEAVQFGLRTVDGESLVAAGVPVPAPAIIPRPFNLVRSSRIPSDNTNRWQEGFSYLPEGIGSAGISDAGCAGDYEEMVNTDPAVADWTPYALTAEFKCSTFGAADYEDRVKNLLDSMTPKLLEWEFWGGPLTTAAGLDNEFLMQIDPAIATVDVSTDKFAIATAVGALENYLANCGVGGRGMIHVPPFLIPVMHLVGLHKDGNLLLTDQDTIVVPGAGYAQYAVDSAGVQKPTLDIYATGITDARIGDIMVEDTDTFDRATNTVIRRAQRIACVSWDKLCGAKVTIKP